MDLFAVIASLLIVAVLVLSLRRIRSGRWFGGALGPGDPPPPVLWVPPPGHSSGDLGMGDMGGGMDGSGMDGGGDGGGT